MKENTKDWHIILHYPFTVTFIYLIIPCCTCTRLVYLLRNKCRLMQSTNQIFPKISSVDHQLFPTRKISTQASTAFRNALAHHKACTTRDSPSFQRPIEVVHHMSTQYTITNLKKRMKHNLFATHRQRIVALVTMICLCGIKCVVTAEL